MKKIKKTKSLNFKISALLALTVLLGIFGLSSVLLVQNFQQTVTAERARLTTIATAFAAASSPHISNQNKSQIFTVLRGMSDIPNATFIKAMDAEKNTLAEIGASVTLQGRDGVLDEHSLLSSFNAKTLIASAPIRANGEIVGSLEIHSKMDHLRADFFKQFGAIALTSLVSAILIAFFASGFITRLIKPLNNMADDLLNMGDQPDLTKKFDSKRNDEVGVLAAALNDAFGHIDIRDKAIRKHNEDLEITVAERTEELREAVIVADKANAAKSDFLATMSHEIRTPMNGMMVMADMLAGSDLQAKHLRYAQIISRSGRSLINLINDILDMSKIEAGKLDMEEIPFSLDTLVHDTISLFAARAADKDLAIGLTIAPDIGDRFIGDPTRLGQIITNLANNALKFTEEGGITIDVSTTNTTEETQSLRISVIDTGIGIPADKVAAIFEAFSQADQSTTRNYGGTGLGLSISKRLIEAMNGDIVVESEEGVGTTFSICLDLPLSLGATQPASAGDIIVNIVDPCLITAEATGKMLTQFGLNVNLVEHVDALDSQAELIMATKPALTNTSGFRPDQNVLMLDLNNELDQTDDINIRYDGLLQAPLSREDIGRLIDATNTSDYSVFSETLGVAKIENEYDQNRDFKKLKVLAVDDNEVNLEVLGEALSTLDIKPVYAHNGFEAVELAQKHGFDVILMDCSMPGMDGYEATAAIRDQTENEKSAQAHIVALTAHTSGEEAEKWKTNRMDAYVAKPFTMQALVGALSGAVHQGNIETDHDAKTNMEVETQLHPLLSQETLDMFEAIGGNNGSNMKDKVFGMFEAQVFDSFDAVVKAVEDPEAETNTIKDLLHALKSMCSSSGAARAADICNVLEKAAGEDNPPSLEDIIILGNTLKDTVEEMGEHRSDDSQNSEDVKETA